jgi:2-polyprenyl-3-methyl-5-hydroxy-6-metoxy-1,4-benzoquinol methylase
MNQFFEQNHKLIYQYWISPDELKGITVLDLGSQTGWLGEYCMQHGASEYVGVDIDEDHVLNARRNYPNLAFHHTGLEDYITESIAEGRMFDIAVISRTIQGIQNQASMLQNLSKITNKIVIEAGVPINAPAYQLLEILKSVKLPALGDKNKEELSLFPTLNLIPWFTV